MCSFHLLIVFGKQKWLRQLNVNWFWQLCTFWSNASEIPSRVSTRTLDWKTNATQRTEMWMRPGSLDLQWKGGNRCGSRRLDSLSACSRVQLCSQPGDTQAPAATTDYLPHNSPQHSKKLLNTGAVQMIQWVHTLTCGLLGLATKGQPGSSFSWIGLSMWHMVKGSD